MINSAISNQSMGLANNLVVFGAMILVQFANAGMGIIIKLALDQGMNQLVFMVYRYIIAMVVLALFAYIIERKQRPPFSFWIMLKIFGYASLGTTINLNLYYVGLAFTSPTVASALSNASPSLTFLMAVLIGVEKVKIKSKSGGGKVMGTLACMGGSLVFTLWRGGSLFKAFKKPLLSISTSPHVNHGNQNWIKGSFLILFSLIAWSAWLISQVRLCKVYPAILSLNALVCCFASLQSFLLALFFSRNITLWKLEWNVQLLAILYSGVLTAVVNFILTWCISKRGPVFTTMFLPLQLIIVAIFSAVAFAETLHLGSLVGALVIVVGMYCFLWGKKMDGVNRNDPPEFSAEMSGNLHDPETGELEKTERNGTDGPMTSTSKDVVLTH